MIKKILERKKIPIIENQRVIKENNKKDTRPVFIVFITAKIGLLFLSC